MRRMRRGLAVPAAVFAVVLVAAGCTRGGGGDESKPLVIGASLPASGDFAQPATAAHQADRFAQYVAGLPAQDRPSTAAYPAQDDPFAKAVIDSVRKQLETIGIRTVYDKVYPADTAYPLNQEFVQQYQAKFGGAPEEDAADAFAAGQVLQAAVEAVGSLDQDRISDWLHDNKVQTILGPLTWDQTGAPQQAFILAQWQDNQSKVVLPREVANTDTIIFPKKGW